MGLPGTQSVALLRRVGVALQIPGSAGVDARPPRALAWPGGAVRYPMTAGVTRLRDEPEATLLALFTLAHAGQARPIAGLVDAPGRERLPLTIPAAHHGH